MAYALPQVPACAPELIVGHHIRPAVRGFSFDYYWRMVHVFPDVGKAQKDGQLDDTAFLQFDCKNPDTSQPSRSVWGLTRVWTPKSVDIFLPLYDPVSGAEAFDEVAETHSTLVEWWVWSTDINGRRCVALRGTARCSLQGLYAAGEAHEVELQFRHHGADVGKPFSLHVVAVDNAHSTYEHVVDRVRPVGHFALSRPRYTPRRPPALPLPAGALGPAPSRFASETVRRYYERVRVPAEQGGELEVATHYAAWYCAGPGRGSALAWRDLFQLGRVVARNWQPRPLSLDALAAALGVLGSVPAYRIDADTVTRAPEEQFSCKTRVPAAFAHWASGDCEDGVTTVLVAVRELLQLDRQNGIDGAVSDEDWADIGQAKTLLGDYQVVALDVALRSSATDVRFIEQRHVQNDTIMHAVAGLVRRDKLQQFFAPGVPVPSPPSSPPVVLIETVTSLLPMYQGAPARRPPYIAELVQSLRDKGAERTCRVLITLAADAPPAYTSIISMYQPDLTYLSGAKRFAIEDKSGVVGVSQAGFLDGDWTARLVDAVDVEEARADIFRAQGDFVPPVPLTETIGRVGFVRACGDQALEDGVVILVPNDVHGDVCDALRVRFCVRSLFVWGPWYVVAVSQAGGHTIQVQPLRKSELPRPSAPPTTATTSTRVAASLLRRS